MALPFDHTHDLDLGVSRSESEIALSQEWGSLLTMNEKDASHPFMTMILTCVTMVGWADVPDSDRGEFRRRHAVDISSLLYNSCGDSVCGQGELTLVITPVCTSIHYPLMTWLYF